MAATTMLAANIADAVHVHGFAIMRSHCAKSSSLEAFSRLGTMVSLPRVAAISGSDPTPSGRVVVQYL